MMNLICIDPGLVTGYALFTNGVLYKAGFRDSCDLFGELGIPALLPAPGLVVIEVPQYRARDRSQRTDPNDLIKLAVLVGEIKRYYALLRYGVELVTPVAWKGSIPKDVHNKHVLEMLRPVELAVMQKRPRARKPDNNMVDAIGLGLWKLGRYRVR